MASNLGQQRQLAFRPLAEPPIFNYEQLMREKGMPSNARLERLWAKDITMGWRWRDEATEAGLLDVYLGWASGASWEFFRKETTREREVFYRGLAKELDLDVKETKSGTETLLYALSSGVISELGLWEFFYLDEDGGTLQLQKRIEMGKDVFAAPTLHYRLTKYSDAHQTWGGWPCKPAYKKYGHLMCFAPRHDQTVLKKFWDGYLGWEEEYEQLCPRGQATGLEVVLRRSSRPVFPRRRLLSAEPLVKKQPVPSPLPDETQPSTKQLSAENAALKKRIAELELANQAAKKQKQ